MEDIRHQYRQQFGVRLDDELLYLLVRMDELQKGLQKELQSKVIFHKGKDYFWYGVGQTVSYLVFGVGILLASIFLYEYGLNKKTYEVKQDATGMTIKMEMFNEFGDTSIIISPTKKEKKQSAKKVYTR